MNRAQKRILHALPLLAAIYCQPSIPRAFFNFPRRFVLSGVNSVYCHCQSRLRAKLLIQILGKLQFQTALPATRTGKKFSRCFKQIDISKFQGGTSWKYLTNLNLKQEDSHLPCSDAVFVHKIFAWSNFNDLLKVTFLQKCLSGSRVLTMKVNTWVHSREWFHFKKCYFWFKNHYFFVCVAK